MDYSKFKILLVDDEADILEFVSYNLKNTGFFVYTATNGKQAIEKAKQIKPHLILLDVMMPKMDGIKTCEEIRKIEDLSNTIVAMLTARNEDYSQIAGFDAGADDYISKPIKPKVLVSRIKALLKRYDTGEKKEQKNKIINVSGLIINKEQYHIEIEDQKIILPKKEFELLLLLVSKPNKVFTREEIYDKMWGEDVIVGDRTIDVHIRKLREKIKKQNIKTIKGVGYKFSTEE